MSSAGLWPAALAQWTSRPGATVTNAGHAFLVTGRPPASSPSVRPDLGRGSQAPLRPTVPATGRLRLVPRTGEPGGTGAGRATGSRSRERCPVPAPAAGRGGGSRLLLGSAGVDCEGHGDDVTVRGRERPPQ